MFYVIAPVGVGGCGERARAGPNNAYDIICMGKNDPAQALSIISYPQALYPGENIGFDSHLQKSPSPAVVPPTFEQLLTKLNGGKKS